MDQPRNIILVGFMGSGKSVVGGALSRLTGRPLVDADEELVRRAGRTISQIFQEDGEAAFRELERSVIGELCSQSGTIIAAGGGSFVDPGNQEVMLASGWVVCLSARPETILQRTAQSQGSNNAAGGKVPVRPLLAGDDPLTEIKALLAQRAKAYALAHFAVATDSLTPEQVAENVLELCRAGEKIEDKA